MAKRSAQDTAAAKAKKQKMILIVGGVLLLAVAAIQVPKLMKGSGSTASPPAAAAAPSAPPTTTGAAAPVTAVATVPTKGAAVVAGVALPRPSAVKLETSQLASFTLFEAKDPFVPKVSDGTDAAASSSTNNPGVDSSGTGTAGGNTAPTVSASTDAKPAPAAPVTFATIDFNSKPQQVELKGTFPTPEPMFVLRSLTKKTAKISVAGGSFDGGKPVTLQLGKKLTLVNSATGVRYVLKLVYTGAQPEVIEGFTTEPAAASKTPTATTTTAP